MGGCAATGRLASPRPSGGAKRRVAPSGALLGRLRRHSRLASPRPGGGERRGESPLAGLFLGGCAAISRLASPRPSKSPTVPEGGFHCLTAFRGPQHRRRRNGGDSMLTPSTCREGSVLMPSRPGPGSPVGERGVRVLKGASFAAKDAPLRAPLRGGWPSGEGGEQTRGLSAAGCSRVTEV